MVDERFYQTLAFVEKMLAGIWQCLWTEMMINCILLSLF
jgi:hypothetical protein